MHKQKIEKKNTYNNEAQKYNKNYSDHDPPMCISTGVSYTIFGLFLNHLLKAVYSLASHANNLNACGSYEST